MKKLFAIMMALGLVGFMACSSPAESEAEGTDESAAVMDEMEDNMEESGTETEMAEEATEGETTEMEATEETHEEAH